MAELLGVDKALNYGLAGLALIALLTVIRVWLVDRNASAKQDERQSGLETTLADLAASAVAESSLTRKAYERNNEVLFENTAAINKNVEVMGSMAEVLKTMMTSTKELTDTMRRQNEQVRVLENALTDRLEKLSGQVEGMSKEKPIKITVKNSRGEVIARLVAEDVQEEDSSLVVTVTTPKKQDKKEEQQGEKRDE
jgi:hypothetical protein